MARTNNSRSLNRLSGLHPLAYMGVEPTSPPQLVVEQARPTPHHYKGFNIGTLWVVENTTELWLLVGLSGDPLGIDKGWWVQVGIGGVSLNSIRTNTGHDVTPEAGLVHMLGGTNIQTTSILGPQPNCVTVSLNDNVTLAGSLSVASLAGGVIFGDATGLLHDSTGSDGQVIIGGGTEPQWASLTAGANIILTPGPNSLTISAVGGGGGAFGGLTADDANVAIPDGGGRINVAGDGVITLTSSTVPNTLTIGITAAPADDWLVGSEAGVATWKQMTSSGGSVTITESAVAINFEAAGIAALTELDGDIGTGATPLAGVITLAGVGGLLYTDAGTIANTVEIGLVDPGVDGQVLISSSAGIPAWASLSAGAGISLTPGHNQIVITNTGGGGGGGLLTVPTDSGIGTVTAGGTLNLYFGDNTNTAVTTTTVPNDTLSVNLNRWIYWPNSDAAASQGGISLGGVRFMHNLGAALAGGGTVNTFLGSQAGNHTLVTGTAINNVAIGSKALVGLTVGLNCTAVGVNALGAPAYNNSARCVAIGHNALSLAAGTSTGLYGTIDCVAIGDEAMLSCTQTPAPAVYRYSRYSVAIGSKSQGGSTKPTVNNTSVGYESLYTAGGTNNCAFGYQSLKASSESNNCAFGYQCNYTATTPKYTACFGNNSTAFQDYGTAIGSSVGAGGKYGTAVGYSALCGNGESNTAIGHNAQAGGSTSDRCIAIGYNAGQSATGATDDNIWIGNQGVANDSKKIRIGTMVTHRDCWVAGIYGANVTPGLSSSAVYADSSGKLFTGAVNSQPAFLARQTSTIGSVVGDGVYEYFLGARVAMVESYDKDGNFYVGNGAGMAATFTAPIGGLYNLHMTVLVTGIPPVPPPPPPPPPPAPTGCGDPLWIRIYDSMGGYRAAYANVLKPIDYSNNPYESMSLNVSAYMYAGDYAKFSAILISPTGGNTLGIGVLPAVTGIFTWCSGYLISAG